MKSKKSEGGQRPERWLLYGVSFGSVFGLLGFLFSNDAGYLVIGLLIGVSMGLLFSYLYPEIDEQESEKE